MRQKFSKVLPGLIICIILAYMGKYIGSFVPNIGGATFAIFLGLLFGNTLGNKDIYKSGAKFCESNLLSYSIVLLGGTLSLSSIFEIGFSGVVFILCQMSITIIASMYIGKKLGFSKNFSMLMASGNAVCGSSAIGAVSPVIGASETDKGIVITMVNLLGTILMLLLPFLATILYSSDTLHTSALIGGVLQSVGQVVASGSLVNESVKDLSTIFKIVRIVFLVVVVIIFSNIANNDLQNNSNDNLEKKSKLKIKVPWYVVGFFITCIFYSTGIIPQVLSKVFKLISNNFEIIALSGIGMRVDFRSLIKQGPKASAYALIIGSIQTISAITLIYIFI